MYDVVVSPKALEIFEHYAYLCLKDNGMECAERYMDAYDKTIDSLEKMPYLGCGRLNDIPEKYRALKYWQHLWLVYQICESSKKVFIDYIIDDRQNYGRFLK